MADSTVVSKTVVALFESMADAQHAANQLERSGFRREDVSIVAGNAEGRYHDYVAGSGEVGKGVAGGAGAGAAIGGGLGLLAGLTALAIPGFGPVIAAGPLVAALTGAGIGAAAGGLIGGLTQAGISQSDAEYYAEGVLRGGILVIVRSSDESANRAVEILDDAGAADVDKKSREWRTAGWNPTHGREFGYIEEEEAVLGRDRTIDRSRHYGYTHTDVSGYRPFSDATVDVPGIGSDYDTDYRAHYKSRYGDRGYGYDEYAPAYSLGLRYAQEDRFRGRDWTEVEADARRDWESRGRGAWEDFKDAVRYGWDKVRGRT
jgi:hypothetical protein